MRSTTIKMIPAILAGIVATLSTPTPAAAKSPGNHNAQHITRKIIANIETKQHTSIPFTLEDAQTQAQQRLGLMYRKHLAANKGMIFLQPKPTQMVMWMQHTYIPLDIVFFNRKMKITSIEHMATPFSLAYIFSSPDTSGAIELKGGITKKDDIHTGNEITIGPSKTQ